MATAAEPFEIEREGDTLIVIPRFDLGDLAFEQIELGAGSVFEELSDATAANVVIDFSKTDYFGTTALGFFVELWKRVRDRSGRMAFCNTSEHEREILELTQLNGLWSICESREDAMRTVRI
jgi:anti-anti-sigma factor